LNAALRELVGQAAGTRPLRVLQVSASASRVRGGVSAMLWNMLDTFQPERIETDLVCTDDDGPDRRLEAADDFVRVGEQRVRYFARQTGFYSVSLPLSTWLARNIERYDVVHAHGLFSFAPLAAAYHARRQKVPYIITPHGMLDRWGRQNRRPTLKALSIKHLDGPLLRDATCVHFTCDAELEQALETGIPLRSTVIPLGVRLDSNLAVPALRPTGSDEPVVLFMARIDPKKGLDLLLSSFAQVLLEHPRAVLVVAGDGERELMARLQGQADSLGISNRIRWLGFVSGDAKWEALASCQVFVLPCRADTFPVAVIEAMAAGRPVVVSREAGISSIVDRGGAGIATDGSVESMTNAISRLLRDPQMGAAIGEAGRVLTRTELTLSSYCDRLEHLYRKAAQTKGA
jgi:glycosyltransferase involved in cell wall biosynthesis